MLGGQGADPKLSISGRRRLDRRTEDRSVVNDVFAGDDPMATCVEYGADTFALVEVGEHRSAGRDMPLWGGTDSVKICRK